jgi:dienelactone hydrolase
MTTIALYHSVLGVRPGILAAAETLREAGHEVVVVDQYQGRVFDDYAEAGAFAESLGFPALMQMAIAGVEGIAGTFVTAGFSNGAGMAEFVAGSRGSAGGVVGSLQFAGALPLQMLELPAWPAGTPVQLHYAANDPFREEGWITEFVGQVQASGAQVETFLDYPVAGHLFTDASLPDEYDRTSADLAFQRALAFLERIDGTR